MRALKEDPVAKILFTTVFKPFSEENKYNRRGDGLWLDYLAMRLTMEPGPFTPSAYAPPNSSIHMLAANLVDGHESVVMEYPTRERFIEEIRTGAYDYIGITAIIRELPKVSWMVAACRKYATKSKVIIGGMVTQGEGIDTLEPDHVCRGEGVAWMRELLGMPPLEKINHPVLVMDYTLKVLRHYPVIPPIKAGLMTIGYGCPQGCDFCATSAFFGRRHISCLRDGSEILSVMQKMIRKVPRIDHFLFNEEDFLLYKKVVHDLHRVVSSNGHVNASFDCFGSVKTVSEYNIEDLVEAGMGALRIGVESADPPYAKRAGKRQIEQVFEDLHRCGVLTVGFFIVGLDHHTPENIRKEYDFLVSLSPDANQISILNPCPGTKLYDRMKEANRIPKHLDPRDSHLRGENQIHPNFAPGELTKACLGFYQHAYENLGPSVFRAMRTWFRGWMNLKDTSRPLLRLRAEMMRNRALGLLPVFLYTDRFLPNDHVRQQVAHTREAMLREFGRPSAAMEGMGRLMERVFEVDAARRAICEEPPMEPETVITRYP